VTPLFCASSHAKNLLQPETEIQYKYEYKIILKVSLVKLQHGKLNNSCLWRHASVVTNKGK
jgi:hypothetical protein